MEKLHQRLVCWYGFCFVALLFVSYPYALIPPQFASLAYHVHVPALFLLTLLSLPVVLSAPSRPSNLLLLTIGLYAAPIVYHGFRSPRHVIDGIELLGYMMIPLSAGVLAKHRNRHLCRQLRVVGSVLWAVLIIYGFCGAWSSQEVTGLSGNRNWMASTLLALLPWVYYQAQTWLEPSRKGSANSFRLATRSPSSLTSERELQRCGGRACREPGFSSDAWLRRRWRHVIVTAVAPAILIVPPTLYLVTLCASRGAWLGLIVYALIAAVCFIGYHLYVVVRASIGIGGRRKWLVLTQVAILGVTMALSARLLLLIILSPVTLTKIHRGIQEDVRIPLWAGTIRMMRDHDWVVAKLFDHFLPGKTPAPPRENPTGVGPGEFARYFTAYRSHSTYHQRLVAAPITIHPHNEFLNIAAQLGVVPALAWLSTLMCLLPGGRRNNALIRGARFSAFIVIFHSFFDMTLTKTPGNLVGLFCLGICWQSRMHARSPQAAAPIRILVRRAATVLSIVVLLPYGLAASWRVLRIDSHLRNGYLAETMGQHQRAYDEYAAVVKLDAMHVTARLYAASVALDRLRAPHLAIPMLDEAYAIDPNFSHINGMIAKALFNSGAYRAALPYHVRECQLYPRTPQAFQNYFVCSAFIDAVDRLPIVAAYLDELYMEKVALEFGRKEATELITRWFDAMDRQDPEQAVAAANAVTSTIHKIFMDPIFYIRSEEQEWPEDILVGDFNMLDYVYWRQLLLAKRLCTSALGDNAPASLSPMTIVERLDGYLKSKITIITAAPDVTPISQTWMDKAGSRASYLCLLATCANQAGLTAVLAQNAAGEYDSCLFLSAKDIIRLTADDAILRVTVPTSDAPEGSGMDGLAPERLAMFFLPQELWLRNQILGVLAARFGDQSFPAMSRIPTLQAQFTLRRLFPDRQQSMQRLATLCLPDLERQILQTVKHTQP